MRPRKSEQDSPPPESSPTPGNVSSMGVRPSDSGGGGGVGTSEFEPVDVSNRRQSPRPRRRDSPSMAILRRRDSPIGMDLGRRRRHSPPDFRRRDSPIGFHRRDSPPGPYRRSPRRPQRFRDNPV